MRRVAITINTARLKDAIKDSGDAAQRFRDYASAIDNKVMSKIDNYSGSHGGNISAARSKLNAKKRELNRKASSFDTFKNDLNNFREDVITRENGLKGRIKSLFQEFGKKYNINTDKTILDHIIDFGCGLFGIDGSKFRNVFAKVGQNFQAIKERVSNWYRAQGGKEIIDAVLAVAIAIATVVIAVAAIIGTGGLVAVLAVVAAVCAFANALVQVIHASKAVWSAAHGDLVTASRENMHADNEGFASALRRLGLYEAATAFAITDAISSIAMVIYGGAKAISNIKSVFKAPAAAQAAKGSSGFMDMVKRVLIGTPKSSAELSQRAKNLKDVGEIAKYVKDGATVLQIFNDTIASRKPMTDTNRAKIGELLIKNLVLRQFKVPKYDGKKPEVKILDDINKLQVLIPNDLMGDKGLGKIQLIFQNTDTGTSLKNFMSNFKKGRQEFRKLTRFSKLGLLMNINIFQL